MALGKQQKTIRGPKPASKKSNLMWMTSLSQFPLLNHPNQKVQNSSLAKADEDIEHGRVYGPFNTADEMAASIEAKIKNLRAAKRKAKPAR